MVRVDRKLSWALGVVLAWPLACAIAENPTSSAYGVEGESNGGETGDAGDSSNGGVASAPGSSAGGVAGSELPASGGMTASGGSSIAKGGSAATGGGSPKGGSSGALGGASNASSGGSSKGGSTANAGSSGAAFGGSSTGGTLGNGGTSGAPNNGGMASGASGGSAGSGADPCSAQAACLLHRYSFNGSGSSVSDTRGSAAGSLVNGKQQNGVIQLSGGTSDQYVALPAGIMSKLTSATLEAWVIWNGGATWQRIFDFGDNDAAAVGQQGDAGLSYLFLSPRAMGASGKLRVAYTNAGGGKETKVDASIALPSGVVSHVAVVVDASASRLALYLNGLEVGQSPLTAPLSAVRDVNNWLGRSQYGLDPEFSGQIQEFRIYGSARDSAELRASFDAGPDAIPSE